MTAKEMFEELGYSQTSLGHVIIFEKKLNYSVKKIMFAPKTVAVFDENMNPLWLDVIISHKNEPSFRTLCTTVSV